eukprot:jgi/Mesvir1/21602/Mv04031-RA.2
MPRGLRPGADIANDNGVWKDQKYSTAVSSWLSRAEPGDKERFYKMFDKLAIKPAVSEPPSRPATGVFFGKHDLRVPRPSTANGYGALESSGGETKDLARNSSLGARPQTSPTRSPTKASHGTSTSRSLFRGAETSYQNAFDAISSSAEAREMVRECSRPSQVVNGNVESTLQNVMCKGDQSMWKAQLRTSYNDTYTWQGASRDNVGEASEPGVEDSDAQEEAHPRSREIGAVSQAQKFFQHLRRHRIYYGDLLTESAAKKVDAFLRTASEADREELLVLLRGLHVTVGPREGQSEMKNAYLPQRPTSAWKDHQAEQEDNRRSMQKQHVSVTGGGGGIIDRRGGVDSTLTRKSGSAKKGHRGHHQRSTHHRDTGRAGEVEEEGEEDPLAHVPPATRVALLRSMDLNASFHKLANAGKGDGGDSGSSTLGASTNRSVGPGGSTPAALLPSRKTQDFLAWSGSIPADVEDTYTSQNARNRQLHKSFEKERYFMKLRRQVHQAQDGFAGFGAQNDHLAPESLSNTQRASYVVPAAYLESRAEAAKKATLRAIEAEKARLLAKQQAEGDARESHAATRTQSTSQTYASQIPIGARGISGVTASYATTYGDTFKRCPDEHFLHNQRSSRNREIFVSPTSPLGPVLGTQRR